MISRESITINSRTKAGARRFGLERDKKIAALMKQGGPRRMRASALARWCIEEMFSVDDADDEWADIVDRVVRSAVAHLDRVKPSGKWGDIANEAQFLLVSSKAIKLIAERYLFLMDYVTENDERVCERCHNAERGGPYEPGGAPEPPLHLHCRCVLSPTLLRKKYW